VDTLVAALVYLVPFGASLAAYAWFRGRSSKRAQAVRAEALEAGLTEPASLHPAIDLALCCGSAACVAACPEKTVIGIIDGKAQLIDPTACIGHGACAVACPTQAITLVFGTETRGVDLPLVSPSFETNVPGLFIAGELGGMGLIRNAIEQGKQAVDAIAALPGLGRPDMLDLLIVGAGPAGFSASLAAKEKGLRFRTIEQDSFGGTVSHFPRGKLVMTRPAKLPIIGAVKFKEISKEALLEFWTSVRSQAGIDIHYEERFEGMVPTRGGFIAMTTSGRHPTRAILLAIGRRGTPRQLGVRGEDLSKVVYRLVDPEQFAGRRVLVVGGGDSALEAAATLAEETDAVVCLSYRGDAFQRARRRNRDRIDAAERSGRLAVYLNSEVRLIDKDRVVLSAPSGEMVLGNDAVIICAGGVLPTPFLHSLGVATLTKRGER
jgi:thioredoxin reductase/NAD-dependent dihydropyrimidine dehydrogenase PreA subunit